MSANSQAHISLIQALSLKIGSIEVLEVLNCGVLHSDCTSIRDIAFKLDSKTWNSLLSSLRFILGKLCYLRINQFSSN